MFPAAVGKARVAAPPPVMQKACPLFNFFLLLSIPLLPLIPILYLNLPKENIYNPRSKKWIEILPFVLGSGSDVRLTCCSVASGLGPDCVWLFGTAALFLCAALSRLLGWLIEVRFGYWCVLLIRLHDVLDGFERFGLGDGFWCWLSKYVGIFFVQVLIWFRWVGRDYALKGLAPLLASAGFGFYSVKFGVRVCY